MNENRQTQNDSYANILREVVVSAKQLIQDEVELVKIEVADSARAVGSHVAQGAIFAGLVALSVLPFLAFAVIGLGVLLGGMYWLSSLVVAIVCATVGGTYAYDAYTKIITKDLTLPRARRQFENIKEAANIEGEFRYEPNELH